MNEGTAPPPAQFVRRPEHEPSRKQKPTRVSGWAMNRGTPARIRTPNLLVRSQALYPIELRAHLKWKQGVYWARRSCQSTPSAIRVSGWASGSAIRVSGWAGKRRSEFVGPRAHEEPHREPQPHTGDADRRQGDRRESRAHRRPQLRQEDRAVVDHVEEDRGVDRPPSAPPRGPARRRPRMSRAPGTRRGASRRRETPRSTPIGRCRAAAETHSARTRGTSTPRTPAAAPRRAGRAREPVAPARAS